MKQLQRILGLIPARGGSRGIPRKNIRLLNGRPLLAYTADAALESHLITDVIVSTDDEEIAQTAADLGLQVPFLRPADLATDEAGSLGVVLHALRAMEAQGRTYDAVCLLQPTSPFREQGLVDAAIRKLEASQADSLITVRRMPDEYNPHWAFEPDESGFLKLATSESRIIARRQDLPVCYVRDGAVYLTLSAVLRDSNSLYGNRIAYLPNDAPPVNIDTPEDWELAEYWLQRWQG